MLTKIKHSYNEYPKAFKVLVLTTFIDRLGSFILFPFYSLYVTSYFRVGMIEVGFLFTIFAVGSIIGSIIGGVLADKHGRRSMILLGLVSSGIGSILMGIVNDLILFYILAAILGLLGELGSPARQAMVVDLLPKEKQAKGFGSIRWALNLSATIGPGIGGFLATYSFMSLFITDALSSLITAIIVYLIIPESKPQKQDDKPEETLGETLKGYKEVLMDRIFMIYISISMLLVIVYMQMNSTLSVFLRDVHGFPEQGFGWLLTMNALMVVLFQFWITKKVSNHSPMKIMAFGTVFIMIGFSMYGFVSEPYLFFISMVFITIGEMIVFPIGNVVVAILAPEDKRGRYMAVFSFQWAIPNLFSVLVAGVIMVYVGPFWVWYFAGILSLIAIIGYLILYRISKELFLKEGKTNDEGLVKT